MLDREGQSHGHQLAVTTSRSGPGPFEQPRDLLPHIIDNNGHPRAEIIEIVYHIPALRCE